MTHSKAIVFTDPDHNIDTCQIVVLTSDVIDPEGYLQHLKHLHSIGEYPHNPANGRIINYPEDVPPNRLFRNSWTDKYDTPTVDVDLDKAKAIHLERIRWMRNKKLESSDKDLIVALSKGDDISEIQSKKQELRDIPKIIEEDLSKIESVEELAATWPEGLEKYWLYNEK